MKFALFVGCNIPVRLKEYEAASRAVLAGLGVQLIDIPEFKCCGYPLRNVDFKAFVLSAARNLALAEGQDLNIMVLCKCGYGTFRMADYFMKEHPPLRYEVNKILGREGLRYEGRIEVKHLLSVLFSDVGVEAVREKVIRPYKNLKVAPQYGCHALRPSEVMRFDDPVAPSIFDQLVELTGAESVDWPGKLDCCGAPLLGTDDDLSFGFTEKKLKAVKQAGAHCLTTACTFCQIQFNTVRNRIKSEHGPNRHVRSILYPQLLGLCMDLDKEALGCDSSQWEILTGV